MAKTRNSVRLPWKRTREGLVADARFRVVLRESGWQCRMGKKVLAEGPETAEEGRRAAESFTSSLAEVEEQVPAATTRAGRRKPPGRVRKHEKAAARRGEAEETRSDADARPAESPRVSGDRSVAAEPAADAGEISFEKVSDGGLLGRVAGVCWLANRREVVFSRGVDPGDEQRVRAAVAAHYRAEDEARAAARDAAKAAARDAEKAKQAAARAAAKAEKLAALNAAKSEKAAARNAAKSAAKAEKAAARAAARTTKKVAKAVDAGAGAATTRSAATRARAARAVDAGAGAATTRSAARRKASPKAAATATPVAAAKKTAKTRGRSPRAAKAAVEGEPVKDAAAKGGKGKKELPAKEKVTVRVSVPAGLTWSEVEGRPRGVAAHGTFLIEAEGPRHALYFHEPGGQSRHLRSGELAELRKLAEEMAARGLPAPQAETISAEKEEALLRMFAAGAVTL